MADLQITGIPEVVFTELQNLASRSEMSLEEYARDVICDSAAVHWHSGEDDITIAQLQANLEAILRLVEQQPVFVVRDNGERHVLLSTKEFDRINGANED